MPYASQAVEEAFGFLQALGGDEGNVSEQRVALLQDAARAGLLMRALMAQMLQQEQLEPDGVSRVTSLINARRSNLVALGLDRVERDALNLDEYVRERDNSADGENPSGDAHEVRSQGDRATQRSDGGQAALVETD